MKWTILVIIIFVFLFGVAVGAGIMHYLYKDEYEIGYTHGKEDAERGETWQF